LGRGGEALPTTAHRDRHGQWQFGDHADDQAETDWPGYSRRFKLRLGLRDCEVLHDHNFTAAEVAERFLNDVLRRCENEALHGRVEHLVVTHPAEFGPAARQDLREVIGRLMKERGDFELMEEPQAAALAWLKLHEGLQQRVMVFDWGGGTLDIAVLEREGDHFRAHPDLLAGDIHLGGEDIDDAILQGVDVQLRLVNLRTSTERSGRERLIMRRTVRRNKEAYATKEKVDWRFNLEGMDNPYAFTWSRGDFKPWIAPKIEQATEIAGRVLENAKKNGLKVDQVILIGGTSNLVFVRETLASRLGIPVLQWDRCIEAVAWGAALKASEKVSKSQSPPTVNPRPPVVQDKPKRERPPVIVTPISKTFASSSTPDVEPQKPTIENPNVPQQAGNQNSQNKSDAEKKWEIWRKQRELEKQQKAASKASAQIEQQETIPIESPEKKVPVTVGHKKNEYGEKIVAILFGWVFVIILGIIFPLSLGLTLFLMVSWTRQVIKDF
jgi:molecular chaperone DnaK (HSP70)